MRGRCIILSTRMILSSPFRPKEECLRDVCADTETIFGLCWTVLCELCLTTDCTSKKPVEWSRLASSQRVQHFLPIKIITIKYG